MRKATCILLVLLMLAAAGYFTAHGAVNAQKENVTWEEETFYGDASHVYGATVSTRNQQDQKLLWETEGVLGAELTPATKFSFTNDAFYREYEVTYDGLILNSNESFLYGLIEDNDYMPEYAKEKYSELIAYVTECYDSVEMGEERYFTVDLSDYMDYYSFEGYMDLPGGGGMSWNEFDMIWTRDRVSEDVIKAIHDYFRIPILGDYTITFSINRHQYGNSFGTSYAGGAEEGVYRPYFNSVYANGACYLSFSTFSETGKQVDTSLIPGGYGIYRVDAHFGEDGKMVMGEPFISMVYPMDENEQFSELQVSDDEKHLYLHTILDGTLYRTGIDLKTMTQLQKIPLVDDWKNFYWDIRQFDDFLVIRRFMIGGDTTSENTVSVFEEDEQGLYHHCFTVPMHRPGFNIYEELTMTNNNRESMDFNGETLLIAQNEYQSDRYAYSYGNNCNFYVTAYNAEGLAYAGKYHVDLAQINLDPEDSNWPCKPDFDDPVIIRWN